MKQVEVEVSQPIIGISLVWKKRGQSLVRKTCKCAVLSDPRSSFAVLGQPRLVVILLLKSWRRANKLLEQERDGAVYRQSSSPHAGPGIAVQDQAKRKVRGRKNCLRPRKDGCSENLRSTLPKSNMYLYLCMYVYMQPVGLKYRRCSAWYAADFHCLDYRCTTRLVKMFSIWFLNLAKQGRIRHSSCKKKWRGQCLVSPSDTQYFFIFIFYHSDWFNQMGRIVDLISYCAFVIRTFKLTMSKHEEKTFHLPRQIRLCTQTIWKLVTEFKTNSEK